MEVQWPSEDLLASEKPSKNFDFPQVFLCFSYHCKSESWALLGGSWAPLGLYLEGLGRLLSLTWAQFERSCGLLGDNLGALGANLGATWSASGSSWALLGPTWAHFELHGPSKASLGLLLEALGRVFWRPQGAFLTVQSGAILVQTSLLTSAF